MAEPDNLVLTLLREMRSEMNARFDSVDERFANQDKQLESIRQALKAETILGPYAVADVDDRLEAIEKRLDALEQHN